MLSMEVNNPTKSEFKTCQAALCLIQRGLVSYRLGQQVEYSIMTDRFSVNLHRDLEEFNSNGHSLGAMRSDHSWTFHSFVGKSKIKITNDGIYHIVKIKDVTCIWHA